MCKVHPMLCFVAPWCPPEKLLLKKSLPKISRKEWVDSLQTFICTLCKQLLVFVCLLAFQKELSAVNSINCFEKSSLCLSMIWGTRLPSCSYYYLAWQSGIFQVSKKKKHPQSSRFLNCCHCGCYHCHHVPSRCFWITAILMRYANCSRNTVSMAKHDLNPRLLSPILSYLIEVHFFFEMGKFSGSILWNGLAEGMDFISPRMNTILWISKIKICLYFFN